MVQDLDLVDSIKAKDAVLDFFTAARQQLGKPTNSSSAPVTQSPTLQA
jgi:hypothetical protein